MFQLSIINGLVVKAIIFFANQLLYLLYLGRIWRWPAALCEGHGHFRSDNSRIVSTLKNFHRERPVIEESNLPSRRAIAKSYLEISQRSAIRPSSSYFPNIFPQSETRDYSRGIDGNVAEIFFSNSIRLLCTHEIYINMYV